MNKYEIINSKVISVAQTNIPDCFVLSNKIGTAHGEAKLYIGGNNLNNWNAFFNNFKIKGVFLKEDILTYLDFAKSEYETQSQGYRRDICGFWSIYYQEATGLDEVILFDIFHKDYKNKSRYYINSLDYIYAFFRRICLPVVTTLIIEIIEVSGDLFAWFRPYINEFGNIYLNEIDLAQEKAIKEDKTISTTTKEQIIKARVGQGDFRNKVIQKYNSTCVVTGVNDKRILIASHIKPWTVSTNEERLSTENGLLLVPTFDKLFDKGLISFKNDGQIILSNYFNDENFNRLKIYNTIKCRLNLSNDMKLYLDYHRDIVFKR